MIRPLAPSLLLAALATTASAQVWDVSRDFSGVQGQSGWSYYYQQGGTNLPMPGYTTDTGGAWYVAYDTNVNPNYWTNIHRDYMHPNGVATTPPRAPVDQKAIVGWQCSIPDTYTVRFRAAKFDPSCGDGVLWEVYANATLKDQTNIASNDVIGHAGAFQLTLATGDFVAFIVSAKSNDFCDGTAYQAAIFGPCQCDLHRDGVVDDSDFVLFVRAYDDLISIHGDFNSDGFTSDADFVLFLSAYNQLLCS